MFDQKNREENRYQNRYPADRNTLPDLLSIPEKTDNKGARLTCEILTKKARPRRDAMRNPMHRGEHAGKCWYSRSPGRRQTACGDAQRGTQPHAPAIAPSENLTWRGAPARTVTGGVH